MHIIVWWRLKEASLFFISYWWYPIMLHVHWRGSNNLWSGKAKEKAPDRRLGWQSCPAREVCSLYVSPHIFNKIFSNILNLQHNKHCERQGVHKIFYFFPFYFVKLESLQCAISIVLCYRKGILTLQYFSAYNFHLTLYTSPWFCVGFSCPQNSDR